MTTRHALVIATVLATAIGSAGCGSQSKADTPSAGKSGSSSTPGPSSPTSATPTADKSDGSQPDACDMVSDDVAASVLGIKIVRREPHSEPGTQSVSCIKGLPRASDPKDFTFVSVALISGGGTAMSGELAQAGGREVSGLGDRARFLPDVGAIYVVKGADLVSAQVTKGGRPGTQEQSTRVMQDVLSRME